MENRSLDLLTILELTFLTCHKFIYTYGLAEFPSRFLCANAVQLVQTDNLRRSRRIQGLAPVVMNAADVQAIVDAAIAAERAAAAAIAAVPVPGAVPAPPLIIPTFARTPAQAKVGILDYGSSEGMKIYNAAIAALPSKYTGNAIDMHVFLKNVKKRAQSFGWREILEIPTADGTIKDLIDLYGLIELGDVKAHALTYENEGGRNAQNASQMYEFLYNSLTEEAKLMVLSDYTDYTIVNDDGIHINNGPTFLKVIIRNTTVDTRSTVYHLRENLKHLEVKMIELGYDIDQFNQYVTSQIEQLAARGETSSDLLLNLVDAYLAVPDKKFVEYIEKQKDKYDEGEDVTPKNLMQVALIKYKDRKRSDKWEAPSVETEQVMALNAKYNGNKADKERKAGGSEKKQSKQTRNEKYAWKLVPPGSGEPKTKEVNKKTYHFCPNHNDGKGAWVIHHPNKCDRREDTQDKGDRPGKEKAMSLAKVLQAIQDESAEGSSSDEDEE